MTNLSLVNFYAVSKILAKAHSKNIFSLFKTIFHDFKRKDVKNKKPTGYPNNSFLDFTTKFLIWR